MSSKLLAGIEKAQKSITKTLGSNSMYSAIDQHKKVYGFKIPALAYQIFILTDHLPFGIHGESAPPHVGKSMLAIQKGIWAIKDGCWVNLTDTEHKHSIDMVKSMMYRQLDPELWPLFKQVPAYSLEESQQINTQLLKTAIEDKYLAKDERYGIFSITDSLLGAAGQDSIDTMLKEGFAKGRGYKEETLSIKNYCEAFDTKGAFFAWNTIQHAKKSLDPNVRGINAWNVIGGDHPRFVAMTHTLMQRADQWESVENGLKVSGHNIKMSLLKNGVGGEDRRVMFAGLRWTQVEDKAGNAHQETWFDWNWSLGWLLAQQTMENPHTPARFKEKLKEVLYFTVKNKNNVICPKFSEKAITYSEFGQFIEEDPEVRQAISNLYGVKKLQNFKDAEFAQEESVEGKVKGKRGRKKIEIDSQPVEPVSEKLDADAEEPTAAEAPAQEFPSDDAFEDD